MSDHQEVAQLARHLGTFPLSSQVSILLRALSTPDIAEEEIKLLAELLVQVMGVQMPSSSQELQALLLR